MIFSTQIVDNKNDEDNSSFDGEIKSEEVEELKNIMNTNQKSS